jgi:hypothetical protein
VKAYTTERVIVQPDHESPVFGSNRVIIRLDDQGAGPYLVIRGDNQVPDAGETPHDFFLQTEDEIDMFAAECKAMLRQAEKENP